MSSEFFLLRTLTSGVLMFVADGAGGDLLLPSSSMSSAKKKLISQGRKMSRHCAEPVILMVLRRDQDCFDGLAADASVYLSMTDA
jgi:hypothetical protein